MFCSTTFTIYPDIVLPVIMLSHDPAFEPTSQGHRAG